MMDVAPETEMEMGLDFVDDDDEVRRGRRGMFPPGFDAKK